MTQWEVLLGTGNVVFVIQLKFAIAVVPKLNLRDMYDCAMCANYSLWISLKYNIFFF